MSDPASDQVAATAYDAARQASALRLQLLLWSSRLDPPAMRDQARAKAREIWPALVRALRKLEDLAPNSAAAGADRAARLQDRRDLAGRSTWTPATVSRAAVAADALTLQLRRVADPEATRAERVSAVVAAFTVWPWLSRTLAEAGQQSTRLAA